MSVRAIMVTGLVLAIVVGAVIGAVFAMHASRADRREDRFGPAVSAREVRPFPRPRPQQQRDEDRERYLAKQRAKANGYGWVDREHGVVRIPVARAMQLLEGERGDPQVRRSER